MAFTTPVLWVHGAGGPLLSMGWGTPSDGDYTLQEATAVPGGCRVQVAEGQALLMGKSLLPKLVVWPMSGVTLGPGPRRD